MINHIWFYIITSKTFVKFLRTKDQQDGLAAFSNRMPSQQPLNHQNLFLLTEYNPPVPGVESDTDSVFETLSDDDGIDEHEMLSDDNDGFDCAWINTDVLHHGNIFF